MKTQTQKIKEHLKSGKPITALEALNKFSCFRLASRINDLKKEGLSIFSEFIQVKNKSGKLVQIKKYYL